MSSLGGIEKTQICIIDLRTVDVKEFSQKIGQIQWLNTLSEKCVWQNEILQIKILKVQSHTKYIQHSHEKLKELCQIDPAKTSEKGSK